MVMLAGSCLRSSGNLVCLFSFQMAVEMFDYLDDVIALQATSKYNCLFHPMLNVFSLRFFLLHLSYSQSSIPLPHSMSTQ